MLIATTKFSHCRPPPKKRLVITKTKLSMLFLKDKFYNF